MKIDRELLNELSELVFLSLEDLIDNEKQQRLEELLERDLLTRKYYFRLINTYLGVQEPDNLKVLHSQGQDAPYDIELWKALANHEEIASAIQIEKLSIEPDEPEPIKPARSEREVSKFSIFTLAFSAAAMLLFTAIVFFTPVRPSVATLTDSINAEWINTKDIPVNDDTLFQGELILAKGLAEITFDGGAIVIVEAPAVFRLESPKSMFLVSGKVSAVVSEYATGFTVNTLSASIVDLGTEFGVSVESDDSCSLHMFKGEARLVVGQKAEKKTSHTITANEARSVDLAGVVEDIKLGEREFVRQIDSAEGFIWHGENFSIADVVGGGNGFGTGKVNCGIDIRTGENIEINNTNKGNYTSGRYIPASNPFVDGIFIPDSGEGPVQISSTGLYFTKCPDTTGRSVGDFLNGAWHNYDPTDSSRHLLRLDGRTFEKTGQALYMHSNKGITFDLDAIRRNIHGVHINKFKAKAGVSDTVLERASGSSRTDFWVLVDGQLKLEQIDVEPDGISFAIDIPLTDQNRFLTIITTDSDNEHDGTSRDWALFSEPVLELENE